ncbi:hypothetical protein Pyrfu_0276 [Pyrolobus fumarii 1A]|uniref:Uncharacterized protein n=1 Tax=Pyrolobus fumarii (strain DSM 11204 / 1A) TaxID=694429 RepID=G0EFA5_PYRF1|nr:hypothetical protein [Pyrolobus fumarii]AEM38148.1 hypothetical protein Pyrfu_0276 [Pyrolobus fumarii 1A]
MSEACRQALERAGRLAPSWARVVWSRALGLYAPDARYEGNALKGFVERVAELLARTCGAVLHRSLVSQRLVAVVLGDWILKDVGNGCAGSRTIRLVLDTGLGIDVNVTVVVGLEGSPRRIEVHSSALECRGVWGGEEQPGV